MNIKTLCVTALLMMPLAQAQAQSSVKEIEQDIARRTAANKAAEAVNPTMQLELSREPTEAEMALDDLLQMRRLFEQVKLVRRQVSELSDAPKLNAILLDEKLTLDQKIQAMMDETEREKKARDDEQRKAEQAAAQLELQRARAAALANRPPPEETVKKVEAEEKAATIEPLAITFVHEFNDGSPTKVGFREGRKLGVSGVVGKSLNGTLNGVLYELQSVENVGISDRFSGQPVYTVVLKGPDGRLMSLNYE